MEKQDSNEELIMQYIASLNEQEKMVMEIAKDHLQSSFDVEKSLGFKKWLSNQKQNIS